MPSYSLGSKTMDCGGNLVKYLLFVFNFIFWVFSLAVLVLGVLYKLEVNDVKSYLSTDFPVAPDLFIAVGTISFIVSFCGCFGAWKENRCILLTFVCLLIILLIIELGVVIIAFISVTNDDLSFEMKKQLYTAQHTGELQTIERSLECCGVLGPDDYFKPSNPSNNTRDQGIPPSCYKGEWIATENLFTTGCLDKLYNLLMKVGSQLGAIGITVAVIQVIEVVFALTLSGIIKSNQF